MTNSQAWNRYAYVLNSPIMYNDPSGNYQILFDGQQVAETSASAGYFNHVSFTGSLYSRKWTPNSTNLEQELGNNPLPEGNLPFLQEPPALSVPPTGMPYYYPDQQPSKGGIRVCDYECLLRFLRGYLDSFNELAGGFDAATLLRTYKGAWKVGRATLPGGPYLEGGVSGLLHYASNTRNPNLSMSQNVAQSFAIAVEVGITDIAASSVGLNVAILAGTAGALTPIPLIDEAIGAGIGWLAGSLTTTLVLDSVFNQVNSSMFPAIGLGEYSQ